MISILLRGENLLMAYFYESMTRPGFHSRPREISFPKLMRCLRKE
jgi:hypothetical protein